MKPDDNQSASQTYFLELLERDLPSELRYSLSELVDMWLDLSERIRKVEKELEKQEAGDPHSTRIYRSVPGIGLVSARILANELGDLAVRFGNERQLFSYTGLTPREHSSGDMERKGSITKCGPSRIRWLLTEVSWFCIRKDPSLKEVYDRIAHKRGGRRAIIAVARRLIGRLRSCFISGQEYRMAPASI